MSNGFTTTIIGHKSTGKTCYLVTLYNMMRAGVNIGGTQLALSMPNEKSADENYLKKQYKNLKEKSKWPLPTGDAIQEYEFFLVKDLKDTFPFSWIDYTGELLGLDGHLREKDYKTVIDRLQSVSTSVLFTLKGELFAQPIPTDEWELSAFKSDNEYDKFNSLMTEYIVSRNEKHNRPPVIVLLITMYDLCKERDFDDIVTEIQTIFPALFKKGCITGIIPVSLGVEEKNGKFVVRPFQVHLPLIFLLLKELEISAKIVEIIEPRAAKFVHVEKTSFWGGVRTFFDINKEELAEAKRLLEMCKFFKEFFGPFEKVFNDTLKKPGNKLVYSDVDGIRHNIGTGD